jgi:hypothetical protein
MNYYTYAYLREDGTPYYIGKGKGRRAYSHCRAIPRPPEERILILKRGLTEEEAFKHEVYMIAVFGRINKTTGILRNLSDGGEGPSGYVRSEEAKQKVADFHRGRKRSEKTRKLLSERAKNRGKINRKPHTEEAKQKMSKSHSGKKLSEETRNKIGAANKGKIFSEETKEKLKVARAKQTPPTLGKKHSPEAIQKMKQSAKTRWARTREEKWS